MAHADLSASSHRQVGGAMPSAVVLVPRRSGVKDRDRIWRYVQRRWSEDVGLPIFEGEHEDGPFNRSKAINRAARLAGDWQVAVIIDADVIVAAEQVHEAIAVASETGGHVLGYSERLHMAEPPTRRMLDGKLVNLPKAAGSRLRVPQSNDRLLPCSSCNVVTRDLFEAVGGFDEMFAGWGWEDVAFRCATETVSGLELAVVDGLLVHLWHKPSKENNGAETTFRANKTRGNRYRDARFDLPTTQALIDEHVEARKAPPVLAVEQIPRRFIRTVPKARDVQAERFWRKFESLHPGWEMVTWRDPIDPAEFPLTSPHWPRCQNGAQLAGLVRLEALWSWGGIYVDSDVEPFRSFEPLLGLECFAAWEDAKVIPDALIGARAGHPAIRQAIEWAIAKLDAGAWESGPGVTTALFPDRPDVALLPPGSFYPYHYTEKERRREDFTKSQPWAFAAHHWSGSWLPSDDEAAPPPPKPELAKGLTASPPPPIKRRSTKTLPTQTPATAQPKRQVSKAKALSQLTVVIPWRGGCPHREAALAWVVERYADLGVGLALAEQPPGGAWSKGAAVAEAIDGVSTDLVAIADGDSWCDGLVEAVQHVATNGGWSVPHGNVRRLTLEATTDLLAGRDFDADDLIHKAYRGVPGGGLAVLATDLYREIPLDPRFEGWGGEDESWGYALRTIVGKPYRTTLPLLHLWHPPQERDTRSGSVATQRLRNRYRARRNKPARMALLLKEAKDYGARTARVN